MYEPAVTNLELTMQGQKKEPRGKTKYSMSFLLMAQQEAMLDIHGEGRLGEDAKPGIVASRTRNGLRKLETISDDGTIPKTVISKYDADGDLTVRKLRAFLLTPFSLQTPLVRISLTARFSSGMSMKYLLLADQSLTASHQVSSFRLIAPLSLESGIGSEATFRQKSHGRMLWS
jgi:hypothetical protein